MAFCTSCGTTLDPQAAACPKCGAPAPSEAPFSASAPVTAPRATPTTTATAGGSNALRVILIIVAIVIGLGIIAGGIVAYIGWRVARNVRVEQRNGETTVTTPFGTVKSSEDGDAAEALEVEIYPGATTEKGSSVVQLGEMRTATAEFRTDDSPDKVAKFYRSEYPEANITAQSGREHTIVVTREHNWITIHITPHGGGSAIQISRVAGKHGMPKVPPVPTPPIPPGAHGDEPN